MNEAIIQLNQDFTEKNAPFDDTTLPEKEALSSVYSEDRNNVLFYGTSLDYNRSADQLWSNILELYEDYGHEFFDPTYIVEETKKSGLAGIFKDIGFRYPNRDANGWYVNSEILAERYDGSIDNLHAAADYNAPELVEEMKEAGFLYIKGVKLAPFYAKIVDMNIVDLDDVWELDIPVDTHIRRLTQDLAGEMDDDEIREYWRRYGQENDIDIMSIDTGLWLIGNQWSEWGQEYWNEISTM